MSIMQQVRAQIADLPPGELITYANFDVEEASFGALAAALSRLARQGVISRYSKGYYYKPKESLFGTLKPSEEEVIAKLLKKDKAKAAYEGGMGLYNRLGLTTQVPASFTLVTPAARKKAAKRSASVGTTKVEIIESPIDFQEEDIDKLELLDAIRALKKIPAAKADDICRTLFNWLAAIPEGALLRLAELAGNYNPATKALLGALLDKLGYPEMAGQLKRQLNPLTNYRLGVSQQVLPNKKDWRIL